MGLDIGTTGTKAIVFKSDGDIISSAYREYPLLHPKPGWISLDPQHVWMLVTAAIHEATEKSREPVNAVAVSCLGEAGTPIGKNGESLDFSIVGFDTRGLETMPRFEEGIGRFETFKLTGMPLNHTFTACKLLWWRWNKPDVFEAAEKFLCYQDYFALKLGLEPVIDPSLASRTMMLDVKEKKWSDKVLDLIGIGEEKLARIMPSGSVVGEIPGDMTKELGLAPGAILAVGGHDQPCGALGAGIVHPGQACDATGTVECLTTCFETPVLNRAMGDNNFCCMPHVAGDLYLTLAYNFTGGSLLKWFRDTLGQMEKVLSERIGMDPYEVILKEMSSEPTKIHVLPHFTSTGTPYFDPHSTGAILGLGLETKRGEFIRAILEGVTMEIKFNMELLERAGVDVKEIRAIGGGTKSERWLQLKADVFGADIHILDVSEAACMGAGILAATALGTFEDPFDAVNKTIKISGKYKPAPAKAAVYREKMKVYKRIYPALKTIDIHGLAQQQDS